MTLHSVQTQGGIILFLLISMFLVVLCLAVVISFTAASTGPCFVFVLATELATHYC